MVQKIHPLGVIWVPSIGLVSMIQIWQVSSECGPPNLVVLVLDQTNKLTITASKLNLS